MFFQYFLNTFQIFLKYFPTIFTLLAFHTYFQFLNPLQPSMDTTPTTSQRPAAFSMYLEPWHADVLDFLNLKKNNGKEEQRARDLFYGLWVPDLFMQRVEEDLDWTLMSPDTAPGLSHVWGSEFNRLYERFVANGLSLLTLMNGFLTMVFECL